MSIKLTGIEKLHLVLQHQQLMRAKPEFRSVEELCEHHGVSRENLRQWRQQLLERADEVFADRRFFREKPAYEEEIERLKRRVEELEKEVLWEAEDE